MAEFLGSRSGFFMPKKIIFDKYQRRSPDYHWQQISHNLFSFNAYVAARYQQAVKLVPRRRNLRILDIGCGDGVLLGLIGRGRLYGVDSDEESLNYAATRIKAKLVKAAAEKLPFKNSYFDVVIATEIIEHLGQPEKLLEEVKRVLKPGGRLILTTPVKSADGLTDQLHVQEFTPPELLKLCRGYFKRVRIGTSHPRWLKIIYTASLGQIGRYHPDFGRWLINIVVILTGWNPFIDLPGQPTQQLAVCQK